MCKSVVSKGGNKGRSVFAQHEGVKGCEGATPHINGNERSDFLLRPTVLAAGRGLLIKLK
jgi:hypothetical protein